jgi:hypothetical protein
VPAPHRRHQQQRRNVQSTSPLNWGPML